jgi:hypothetical protein
MVPLREFEGLVKPDGVRLPVAKKRRRVKASLPPALNIIALTTFARACRAARSTRCCPMSPMNSASASQRRGFSAYSPSRSPVVSRHGRGCRHVRQGAADDRLPRLLGIANIPGRDVELVHVLFITRILAGIGSGGVFPVSLSLVQTSSDRTSARSRSADAGGLNGRQSARRHAPA